MIRNLEIQSMVDEVLVGGKADTQQEVQVLIPAARRFLVNAAAVIREGQLDGAVLVFHDITELRRLERIRQDFVANVSHELRTPAGQHSGVRRDPLGRGHGRPAARQGIPFGH